MLLKGMVVAGGFVAVGLTVNALNVPEVYDEMYPADGLKRGVLSLCHESDPTFVRAAQGDRLSCYEKMPRAIAVAIGWARRPPGLMDPPPPKFGTLEAAELFMTTAEGARTQGNLARLVIGEPGNTDVCQERVKSSETNAAESGTAAGKRDQPAGPKLALLPPPPQAPAPQKALPGLPTAPVSETRPGHGQSRDGRKVSTAQAKGPTSTSPAIAAPGLDLGGAPTLDLGDRPAASSSSPPPASLPCPPKA